MKAERLVIEKLIADRKIREKELAQEIIRLDKERAEQAIKI